MPPNQLAIAINKSNVNIFLNPPTPTTTTTRPLTARLVHDRDRDREEVPARAEGRHVDAAEDRRRPDARGGPREADVQQVHQPAALRDRGGHDRHLGARVDEGRERDAVELDGDVAVG